MRVSTLPRIGTVSMSRPKERAHALSWAARRGDPVPIRDPAGSSAKVSPSRAISASRGSSRRGIAASRSPSGSAVGRSFSECTARSISPLSSASRSAETKTPVPPICARCSREVSPYVVISTSSTGRPVASRTRSATRPDWAMASALRRVPRRSGAAAPEAAGEGVAFMAYSFGSFCSAARAEPSARLTAATACGSRSKSSRSASA